MVPSDLLTGDGVAGILRDFPADLPSGEEGTAIYFGVVVAEEEDVVNEDDWLRPRVWVRTLARVDIRCFSEGCEGLDRLRRGQLVQLLHHLRGPAEGSTFITCTAEQCTRSTSLVGSRDPSRPPSRAPSPPPPSGGQVLTLPLRTRE